MMKNSRSALAILSLFSRLSFTPTYIDLCIEVPVQVLTTGLLPRPLNDGDLNMGGGGLCPDFLTRQGILGREVSSIYLPVWDS